MKVMKNTFKMEEKLKLIPFKTINLYDVLGEVEFKKLKTTTDFEELCYNLFDLSKPDNNNKNRGDFVRGGVYWDHKNCKVVPKSTDNCNYFIKVKYSNVFAKVWVQLAMKELDEIMKHIPIDYRITIIRYKTEIHLDDLRYIDYQIERLRGKVEDTNSYCLKYNIDFTDFCNQLCIHNVTKYSNLILIHNCPSYDTENVHKVKEWKEDDVEWYTSPNDTVLYLLTPIDVNRAIINLDYIGFGGFKIVVSKYESKKEYEKLDFLKPLYDEIDLVTDLIKYQNDLIGTNSNYDMLYKMTKDKSFKYKRDKWDFSEFKKEEVLITS